MQISLIAAASMNGVIGKGNTMPWHIPEDLKRFKELTLGHFLIMGRNTFESIGKPLPGRTTIIITRNKEYKAPNSCLVFNDIDKALSYVKNKGEEQVFIAGGGEIYDQTIDKADKIFLTKVLENIEGDTYFPFIDYEKDWAIENYSINRNTFVVADESKKISNEYKSIFKEGYSFEYINLVRKKTSRDEPL